MRNEEVKDNPAHLLWASLKLRSLASVCINQSCSRGNISQRRIWSTATIYCDTSLNIGATREIAWELFHKRDTLRQRGSKREWGKISRSPPKMSTSQGRRADSTEQFYWFLDTIVHLSCLSTASQHTLVCSYYLKNTDLDDVFIPAIEFLNAIEWLWSNVVTWPLTVSPYIGWTATETSAFPDKMQSSSGYKLPS